jgi:hypothetical protein
MGWTQPNHVDWAETSLAQLTSAGESQHLQDVN